MVKCKPAITCIQGANPEWSNLITHKLGKDASFLSCQGMNLKKEKKKKSFYESTLNGNSLIVLRSSAGCLAH